MKWDCRKKIGEKCPIEDKISINEDILLIDCMGADCPHLAIEGFERKPPTSCVGEMPNDSTDGTLTTD